MQPKKDDDGIDGETQVVTPRRRPQSSEVVLSPSIIALTAWTVEENTRRLPALVVPGPTHTDRQETLKQYVQGEWRRFHSGIAIDADPTRSTEWLNGDIPTNLMTRVRDLPMPPVTKDFMAKWYPHEGPWELIWNLVAVEEFFVDEPMRTMVDKPFYLIHDVHRVLWEARFLARENDSLQAAEELVNHFIHWILGEPLGEEGCRSLESLGIKRHVSSPTEKLDVVCFLLCLACQNGLLERSIFFFDDLEHALQPNKRSLLRQLWDLIECTKRWARIGSGGSPLGLLFGFTGSRTDLQTLTKLHPKLFVEVNAGLNWARKSV